mmetsp:Transcript_111142/g.325102  ORF Transcript_111142/g.325102 Transcript_111142/m.325102 type:complete len:296 (+) Transcript_111142:717-1604(+)
MGRARSRRRRRLLATRSICKASRRSQWSRQACNQSWPPAPGRWYPSSQGLPAGRSSRLCPRRSQWSRRACWHPVPASRRCQSSPRLSARRSSRKASRRSKWSRGACSKRTFPARSSCHRSRSSETRMQSSGGKTIAPGSSHRGRSSWQTENGRGKASSTWLSTKTSWRAETHQSKPGQRSTLSLRWSPRRTRTKQVAREGESTRRKRQPQKTRRPTDGSVWRRRGTRLGTRRAMSRMRQRREILTEKVSNSRCWLQTSRRPSSTTHRRTWRRCHRRMCRRRGSITEKSFRSRRGL